MKVLTSVSALVVGLALSGAAMAQTAGADDGSSAAASNTDVNNNKSVNTSIPGLNNNSLLSGNTDNSNHVRDSYNSDVDDSYNTDNSTTTFDLRLTLSAQTLSANVSDVSFGGGSWDDGADNRSINTGDISSSGNAYQAMAGIQTASTNSGFGSSNQSATMVSANSNVTFGAP